MNPIGSTPTPLFIVTVGVTVRVTAGAQAADDGTLPTVAVETTVLAADDVKA